MLESKKVTKFVIDFFVSKIRHAFCSGAEQNSDEMEDDTSVVRHASLLLIMKWGGELTPFGREQAVEMGKACRFMSFIIYSILKKLLRCLISKRIALIIPCV